MWNSYGIIKFFCYVCADYVKHLAADSTELEIAKSIRQPKLK